MVGDHLERLWKKAKSKYGCGDLSSDKEISTQKEQERESKI